MQQSYLWYGSSEGDKDGQPSGAYIFRPNGAPPTVVSRSVPMKVVRGSLLDEVHQQFGPWIYQVTRLYNGKEHSEVQFTIGPIPTDDSVGKEVITRLTANLATDKVFYTDSNARDFLKRLNLGIFTADKKSELSVLVDRATGGAIIKDGELELMLHRHKLEGWTASRSTKASSIDPNYSLPLNVAMITRQGLDDGSVLLRLAHLYEAGEDPEYSTLSKVELKKLFTGKTIKEVTETSLSANQDKSKIKRLTWKVEGHNEVEPEPVRGSLWRYALSYRNSSQLYLITLIRVSTDSIKHFL